MNKTYPSVDAYYKHVSQKSNQKDHTGFLSARKEWVNQRNQAGPDRKRLLSKTELLEAKKKLNFQKRTGGKFLKPKKQFVERDSWDPKQHGGEYDPSKEVAENLFGKEVRGVWILKGRKGVYDFEEFQEAAMEETENIHDSRDAPFSEVALARKKKAALDQFTQGSQAREKMQSNMSARNSAWKLWWPHSREAVPVLAPLLVLWPLAKLRASLIQSQVAAVRTSLRKRRRRQKTYSDLARRSLHSQGKEASLLNLSPPHRSRPPRK